MNFFLFLSLKNFLLGPTLITIGKTGAYYLRPRLLSVSSLRPTKKDSKKIIAYLRLIVPFETAKLRSSTNKS
jgi:hypothetical protein